MTVEQVTRPKDSGLPRSAERPRVELIHSLAGRVRLDRIAGTAEQASQQVSVGPGSRTGLPNPAAIVAAAKRGLESIIPYRGLIAAVLAFNAAAAGAALGVDIVRGDFPASFGKFGPVQALYAIELLLIAYVIKHRETSPAGAIGRPPVVGSSTAASESG